MSDQKYKLSVELTWSKHPGGSTIRREERVVFICTLGDPDGFAAAVPGLVADMTKQLQDAMSGAFPESLREEADLD